MTVRKNISLLLLTILLVWFGGIGNLWAQGTPEGVHVADDGQSGWNDYVKYLCSSAGFNIQFMVNGTGEWQKTTWNNSGYTTVVSFDGNTKYTVGSVNFQFGTPYEINNSGIIVSIEASIADATTKAVTIQYNIENTNDYDIEDLKIGTYADTQVGSDDYARITREGKNKIMMTATAGTAGEGAMYGIQAGTEEFTTLWAGVYYDAYANVFNDGGDNVINTDSGLAWSWTIDNIPAHGTKIIAIGGLASQKGAVSMSGYRYGETPSTPTVSGIEGNPTITYYYNTTDQNSGGTLWSGITGTTLAPGKYYIYAEVGATTTTAAMTTPTTPFTVSKAIPQASDFAYTAPSNLVYNGTQKTATVTTNLTGGKTGMGAVTVKYYSGTTLLSSAPKDAGTYTVKIDVAEGTNYTAATDLTSSSWTFTIAKATPQASDFTFTPPSNLVYNGTPKTASVTTNLTGGKTGMGTVTVKYYSGTTLLSSAPQNAGTYTVKIDVAEGTNYAAATGITASSWTFTILPKAITSNDITVAIANAIYTGQTQTPVITVVDGTRTTELVNNTDYTISYKGSTLLNAQTYASEIIITGIGNYTGTRQEDFTINPKDINLCTVDGNSVEYTGSNIVPGATIMVKDGATTLNTTSHYTLTVSNVYTYKEPNIYANAINIIGKGNYTGTKDVNFKVTKALNGTYAGDFTISAVPTQIYDGANAVNPSVSVYDKGNMLTKGTHYTITYGGNNTEGVNAGTITINGLDPYSGSKAFQFDIVNEYFTESNITYHATSSTTVAMGNHQNVATTLTGTVEIPTTVTHVVATPFQVTGIEAGAFKNKTDVTGISMPHAEVYLVYIENGAFEGCTNLRYIDLCHATSYTPTSLQRHIAASPFYGVPKQALVYLNGSNFNGENYVYKPGDGNDYYCELFKVYDDVSGSQTAFSETNGYEWKFENRHSFTAYTVENTRQLTAGKHYTVCLPYDLPLPSTLKAFTMDGSNSAQTLIGFTEVTGTLGPTGTPDWLPVPYVVIPSVSGQLLNASNTVVHEFKEDVTNKTTLNGVTKGNFTFYGTMRYMDGDDATGLYIMQYNNGNPTWMQIAAGSGFNQSNKACVLPMRAYIKNTGAGAPPYINATFTDATGATTTVKQLRLDENDAEEEIYDLSGRRVKTPRKGGLYIINQRKVRK